ncbi:MAG: PTS sugar transporter subunit IIA [Rubinisphaera brasiliensis]|uniref:PTS IIA-like nitrogen-regulatory protein PtsN n=1 Tax=Rubinisphaera brasiliensis (strain ATCC 49424 / DSM 5305 / JCM 21570 / IAM 15109 / NBRC 103401 / IFAM 1448) TaxID=756272 RepID=F0SQA6_RUBBR|nr:MULTISPECIES: PTS sugar transporter subunit IIA [Rubinisphaera]ADY62285.1 PTS IIA-like nitrogen-regulatory protein PtsN [Rubinisphaera brasiliensis DSM 5305]MBB01126.1 PTS fructose transporter subunit IIA [Planctomyces sp.]MBR9801830.1 PTS sugar transporter subunit IIA [bacterium]
MKFSEIVVKESVVTDLNVETKEDAIRRMVASLKSSNQIAADNEESIVSAILKREELGSTGIGKGIAVPHTKHPSVEDLVATIAIAPEGVDFASLDGEDVFILFLLISPPDRPGDHLRALETISRHLRNENFCNFLRQSKTPEEVMELLREADQDEI